MEIALQRVRDWIPGTSLNLSKLGLTSLPPLPATLRFLDCYYNQLTSLRSLPATLEMLDCSGNQLTSLPPLPATLRVLDCYNNQLTSLRSLPVTLQRLFCWGNKFPNRNNGESIPDFQHRIETWAQETIVKPRIQTRTRTFKEELMMNRWAPARVEAALESGLELEDL